VRQLEGSVVDIAFHRSAAVTVGVCWAGFVSRFWWPSEARRELSKRLGEYDRDPPFFPSCSCLCNLGFYRFCLNMGWLYTRLVASNSSFAGYEMDDGEVGGSHPNEETSLLQRRLNDSVEEFMAMYNDSLCLCGDVVKADLIE